MGEEPQGAARGTCGREHLGVEQVRLHYVGCEPLKLPPRPPPHRGNLPDRRAFGLGHRRWAYQLLELVGGAVSRERVQHDLLPAALALALDEVAERLFGASDAAGR